MSITKLTPTVDEFYDQLSGVVTDIKSGHRVQVLIPNELSHWGDALEDLNWDELEELQMAYRGSILNPNVFVVLRFDQKDESKEVIVDVCHFAS